LFPSVLLAIVFLSSPSPSIFTSPSHTFSPFPFLPSTESQVSFSSLSFSFLIKLRNLRTQDYEKSKNKDACDGGDHEKQTKEDWGKEKKKELHKGW
jgi:hypothetical protein